MTCIHASQMFIYLWEWDFADIFCQHSVMSHVLNLFAFILLLIGVWLLHRTHCFAMCLWVCATFWSETIQTSNVIFGQDRKLSEKEIITKTKPEDWPKCAWNQIEDNMEPESSCKISICYDLLPVLNISRNFYLHVRLISYIPL